MQPFKQTHTSQ